MKAISPALRGFLNAARNRDFPLTMANCYSFRLVNGWWYYFTDYDLPIMWQGNTFEAQSVLVEGVKYKIAVGLEVDRQQLTISPAVDTTINGSPWLIALRDGAFDGAFFRRDRVFMDPALPGGMDGLTLFQGRVSTIDKVTRISAQITVASPLVVLDYYMPKNIFSPTCLHVLYDSGCQANKTVFETQTRVGVGSTNRIINCSDGSASTNHVQGAMYFNSGIDAGLRATIKSVNPGVSWELMYPLPEIPQEGDSLLVYFGCDHTPGACQSKFNNIAHFRGFPNVPPPDYAI
jgi:uncharacterized phage protein (TIGR02218 family)